MSFDAAWGAVFVGGVTAALVITVFLVGLFTNVDPYSVGDVQRACAGHKQVRQIPSFSLQVKPRTLVVCRDGTVQRITGD